MVVALKISVLRDTGMVPKTAIIAIDNLPNERFLPKFKSTESSFENDENVLSSVDAAEVIIIKLMTNNMTSPKALPTSTAAWPAIPCDCAYTPITLNRIMQAAPNTEAIKKLRNVTFGELKKALSVNTGS